ncbi:thioredoxin [Blattabacterium cuenoti]|uniref:thioredoxin n=1 Tax=Blattabacterium cuenoti TaxID=1653831 RepID=UPI00163C5BDD|nr:thioredoxin [Blattabacterium cuenoti]
MIQEINDESFEKFIRSVNKPILVDFWAPWCAPCRTLSSILEDVYNEYNNKVLVGKLNVDQNPKISSIYGIRSIPTIFFFKNRKKIDMHIGVATKEEIRKKLDVLMNID